MKIYSNNKERREKIKNIIAQGTTPRLKQLLKSNEAGIYKTLVYAELNRRRLGVKRA